MGTKTMRMVLTPCVFVRELKRLDALSCHTIRFTVMIVALVFFTSCSGKAPMNARHLPSGLNSRFTFSGGSFDDYIAQSRKQMTDARLDLSADNRARIIDGNAPFSLAPAPDCAATSPRRGILLSHGLTDSPYSMRALGQFFQQHCFHVRAILLPGHGTRPGDLLEVTWQEWAKAVAFGVERLAREVDEVYLAGFSTGGALSIHHALNDRRIKGLFLFSPAVEVSSLAVIANWHKLYSWAFPSKKWIDLQDDESPFKYESFPFNAADQIHLLTREVKRRLEDKTLTVPIFIAASEDDATVHTSATLDLFQRATHPTNRMILYGASAEPLPPRVERVEGRVETARILGSAHTAIVVPPSDPHFGVAGDYAMCGHYFKDAERYRLCKNRQEAFLGETTPENLKRGVIRRLTYNPHYDAMTRALSAHLEAIQVER